MNKLMFPLAGAALLALTGCVGYGGGTYYGGGGYYGGGYYDSPYYGSPYYGYNSAVVIERRPTYVYGGTTYYRDARGTRDRDRDGVPNRYDRDRDGDGVSNNRDAYPNDPRRR